MIEKTPIVIELSKRMAAVATEHNHLDLISAAVLLIRYCVETNLPPDIWDRAYQDIADDMKQNSDENPGNIAAALADRDKQIQ